MADFRPQGLTYDDVLLVHKRSGVASRQQVSTTTVLSSRITLGIPIVSANMDTVTEAEMAIALARHGGIGIIHRFNTIEQQVHQVAFETSNGQVSAIDAMDTVHHRLFASDCGDRVMVFNLDANNDIVSRTASNMLGQPDFTHETNRHGQAGLDCAVGSSYDAAHNRLFVVDDGNNRVEKWALLE